MKYYVLAAILVFPAVVSAQVLDRTREGRVRVSQCYADCAYKAQKAGHLLRFEWEGAYYGEHVLISCIEFQEYVRALEACYTSCLDIEEAYGVRKSHARARFITILNHHRTPLQKAGLWTNYKGSPSYTGDNIDDFTRACKRFTEARQQEFEDFNEGVRAFSTDDPFVVNGVPADELDPSELNDLLSNEVE